MRSASYVYLRPDTGSYAFRWTVPVTLRPLLGGRRDVRKSLNTSDRRTALRVARHLRVMLERATILAMSQHNKDKRFYDIKLLERLVDGTIRIEGLTMDSDPARAEEDRKHLAALLGTAAPAANAPATDERTLGQLVAAYIERGEREERYTAKTRQEVEAVFKLVLEVMGDGTSVAKLTRADFARFKDVLMRLPSNASKSPAYRGKSALDLADLPIPKERRLNIETCNKKLGWVASLTKYGHVHGWLSANFAEGLQMTNPKRAHEQRDAYTDEEALKLKEALLNGEAGSARKVWRKWVVLLLMYQGMRVNEAAQLRVADIGEVDGIPTLAITAEAGRTKTDAAERTIPIHPELLKLGFLSYVAERRKRGVTRLFDLKEARDGHGAAVSRWFRDWRKEIGLGHRDLHALRHSWATALKNADVSQELTDELGGWAADGSEGARRYAKASTQQRLLAALAKLHYGPAPAKPQLHLVS